MSEPLFLLIEYGSANALRFDSTYGENDEKDS